ncbi:hypothetical protein LCGC14_0974380 [marine sediment metagenome]|uniref:Uncharacterized protein n=1 Tax=marine sediment metagenome TaxID=412755 RepID=A0A0F9RH40_9ZZZZ
MDDRARARIQQYVYEYCKEPDTKCVAFRVLGRPQPVGSKVSYVPLKDDGRPYLTRAGRPAVSTTDSNKKAIPWMAAVRAAAAEIHQGDLLTVPLMLSAIFFFRRTKGHYGTGRNANKLKPSAPKFHAQTPDLAKLVRAVEDGMTGIVYRDDKQICAYGDILREWTTEQERAEIWILALEPQGDDDQS